MHVKEQVKEFVHDVKRRFSHKHKRDSCSTFDSYDYSSTDNHSHICDSSSSSSISSEPDSPKRGRFIKFIRRTPSTSSKTHNVLRRAQRVDERRHRLFSAPTVPSERIVEPHLKQPASFQGSPGLSRDMAGERVTVRSSQDFSDVMDISARASIKTGTATPVTESTQSSLQRDRDSLSQSQPPFDTESRSDTSGTLVTTSDHNKSASGSASPFNSVDLGSDINSEKAPLSSPIDPMADLPPAPPPKVDPDEDAPPTVAPAPPPRTATPPAPVYIPRLTVPSMFLPIPNTDPLSALLTKYVPAEQRPRRDVVGEYAGRDIHEMVMSNSWRALAKMARDRIVASDPEDLGRILDLWSLRLSSLARLRLTNQASAECTNLFAVLNAVHATSVPGTFPGSGSLSSSTTLPASPAPAASSPLSPSGLSGLAQLPGTPSQKPSTLSSSSATPATAPRQGANELLYPFELTVFHARVHYWSGDSLGYVDALSRILVMCKEKAREEGRIVMQRRELGKASKVRGDVESMTRSERASGGEDGDGKEGKDLEDAGVSGENTRGEDKDENKDKDSEDTEVDTENIKSQDEDEDENRDSEEAEVSTENTESQGENENEGKDSEDTEESTETQEEKQEERDEVLVAAEANLSMWLERIARVCLILASQMIEMNDYQAAVNLLAPLCAHRAAPAFLPTPSPAVHSALARVYLLSGNLQKAEEHFSIAASAAVNGADGTDFVAMNTALLAAASGDWKRAEEALSEVIDKDPGNFTAINNLAVTLLCQGRISEGIDLLEAALNTSPSSVVVAEPFLFNLSTLYELRSTAAIDKKRGLLIEVSKWSGDGLKTSCLKMPSS